MHVTASKHVAYYGYYSWECGCSRSKTRQTCCWWQYWNIVIGRGYDQSSFLYATPTASTFQINLSMNASSKLKITPPRLASRNGTLKPWQDRGYPSQSQWILREELDSEKGQERSTTRTSWCLSYVPYKCQQMQDIQQVKYVIAWSNLQTNRRSCIRCVII